MSSLLERDYRFKGIEYPITGTINLTGFSPGQRLWHNVFPASQTLSLVGKVPIDDRATTEPTTTLWPAPSLQDETDFYADVMGWSIPTDADEFGSASYTWNAASTYGISSIHGDTEGDDLWAWFHQRQRYGVAAVGNGSTTQDWKDNVADEYITDLLSLLDAERASGADGDGYDHLYGQGVAELYNEAPGTSGLADVIEGLRTRITGRPRYQDFAAQTPSPVSYWLGRGVARWAIAAAYCYEATQSAAWGTVRDNLMWAYKNATDWVEGGVVQNGGGMFCQDINNTTQYSSDGISTSNRYQ